MISFPLTLSGFPLVSLMKPVDINPNDEWINVSKHISGIPFFLSYLQIILYSYSTPRISLCNEFHLCSLLLLFLFYHLLLIKLCYKFFCRWPWLECLHRYVSFYSISLPQTKKGKINVKHLACHF